jgi:hypothetical protein
LCPPIHAQCHKRCCRCSAVGSCCEQRAICELQRLLCNDRCACVPAPPAHRKQSLHRVVCKRIRTPWHARLRLQHLCTSKKVRRSQCILGRAAADLLTPQPQKAQHTDDVVILVDRLNLLQQRLHYRLWATHVGLFHVATVQAAANHRLFGTHGVFKTSTVDFNQSLAALNSPRRVQGSGRVCASRLAPLQVQRLHMRFWPYCSI